MATILCLLPIVGGREKKMENKHQVMQSHGNATHFARQFNLIRANTEKIKKNDYRAIFLVTLATIRSHMKHHSFTT